jgi:hypothetical protein
MNTPTTNFGFNKPARNDFDWDLTLNSNFDKIDTELARVNAVKLGLAASGYVTKDYFGTFVTSFIAADIAALKAATGMTSTSTAIVRSFGTYLYDPTSTDTADDRWIVIPNSGVGRWYCENPGADLIMDLIP